MQNIIMFIILHALFFGCNPSEKRHTDIIIPFESKTNNILLCDTSKICFIDKMIKDTLLGKGVMRITLKSNECDNIEINSSQIILLIINTVSKSKSSKIIDYRYLVTKNLQDEEKKILVDYEKKIISVFKERGLCCSGEEKQLDGNRFDFSFTFKVYPSPIETVDRK